MASATAPTTTTGNAPQTPTQNLQARQMFLQNSQPMNQNLGTFGPYAPGARLYEKLVNVGVLTRLLFEVTATITNSSTAAIPVTPSPAAPWNLISWLKVKDFTGTEFINLTGLQLFNLNCIRLMRKAGFSMAFAGDSAFTVPVYNLPEFPSSIPASGSATLKFLVSCPIAYAPNSDLTGAILMQSVTGQMYTEILWNNSIFGVDDDSVYSSGVNANLSTSIQCEIVQEYRGVVAGASGAIVLPEIDLGTVYELNGTYKDTSGIVAGVAKKIPYSNFRTVLTKQLQFMNGGVLEAGNVTALQLVANSNQFYQTFTESQLAQRMREALGFDITPGCYHFSTREHPIETVLYGNIELWFTPSNVSTGNTYIGQLEENFYPRGATLTSIGG